MNSHSIALTEHADRRMKQRGVKSCVLDFLLEHADQEQHVGDNCISMTLSKCEARRLLRRGHSHDLIGRASNIAAIEGRHGIVTVMHCHDNRYRKQGHTRKPYNIQ